MMVSSERASAAAHASTNSAIVAAYRARRYRGFPAAIRRSPLMSFGEASAFACGLAYPAEVDSSATAGVGSQGQIMAREATITNTIRIPASVLTGKAAGSDPCRQRHRHCDFSA